MNCFECAKTNDTRSGCRDSASTATSVSASTI